MRKKLELRLFLKNGHPPTWTPTAPRKNILFKKKYGKLYLRVGLHEYHNENPNGDFRFLRSCDSYRIWHLKSIENIKNINMILMGVRFGHTKQLENTQKSCTAQHKLF